MNTDSLLLDTCVLIWLGNRDPIKDTVRLAIEYAESHGGVFVSPVSAWEIGLLAYPNGHAEPLAFRPDAQSWFARIMAQPGVFNAPLTPAIAIASATLPGQFHRDPGDRLLVATARDLNIPIVTRDRKILDYAAAGHVAAIACR